MEQIIQQPEQQQHWPDKFYLAPEVPPPPVGPPPLAAHAPPPFRHLRCACGRLNERQSLLCRLDGRPIGASVSQVVRTNVSARMLFTKVYNKDTDKAFIAGGSCFYVRHRVTLS